MKTKTMQARAGLTALLTGALLALSACSSTPSRRTAGTYIDDVATETRIKTALLRDPLVKGTSVDVNVFRGTVSLSGFVASPQEKQRAVEIARSRKGVNLVEDALIVKTELPNAPVEAVGRSGGPVVSGAGRGAHDALTPDQTRASRMEPRADRSAQADQLEDIRIQADDGIVTVQGVVSSHDEKMQIGQQLLNIPGIQRVNNELTVRGDVELPSPGPK